METERITQTLDANRTIPDYNPSEKRAVVLDATSEIEVPSIDRVHVTAQHSCSHANTADDEDLTPVPDFGSSEFYTRHTTSRLYKPKGSGMGSGLQVCDVRLMGISGGIN